MTMLALGLCVGFVAGWLLRGLATMIGRFGHNVPDPFSDETDGYHRMDVSHEAVGKLRFIRENGVDAYIDMCMRGDLAERQ